LVIVAAMSEDQALRAWRTDMCIHMLIALVLSGAVGLLCLHLTRQIRRSQAAEERYHLLLQAGGVTEALCMLDPHGDVQTWNAGAERTKGYAQAEIIGRNFATFFTPEDAAKGEPARHRQFVPACGRP